MYVKSVGKVSKNFVGWSNCSQPPSSTIAWCVITLPVRVNISTNLALNSKFVCMCVLLISFLCRGYLLSKHFLLYVHIFERVFNI